MIGECLSQPGNGDPRELAIWEGTEGRGLVGVLFIVHDRAIRQPLEKNLSSCQVGGGLRGAGKGLRSPSGSYKAVTGM